MSNPRKSKLTLAIKIYLDLTWWACLAAIVPTVLILPVFLFAYQIEEEVQIGVLARFELTGTDTTADSGDGPAAARPVRGQGILRIPQDDKKAWALQFVSVTAVLIVILYVLSQLRALLRSVREDQPFAPLNAKRIRNVGLAVVGWNLLSPFAKYAVGKVVLDGVQLPGVLLRPPLDFRPEGLFLGLAILVLAGIFHRASLLQQEQNLTV